MGRKRKGQTLLTVQSLRPLVIHHKSLSPQQDMQSLNAETAPLLCKFPQAPPQLRIPILWRRTPYSAATDTECHTSPPLGGRVCRLDIAHGFPA